MKRTLLILLAGLAFTPVSRAQTNVSPGAETWNPAGTNGDAPAGWSGVDPENDVYYATVTSIVFSGPDSTRPYVEIQPREPVEMVRHNHVWAEVKTASGAKGFVNRRALSNVWIRVSKDAKTVWLHRGSDAVMTIPADMAYNFFLDKERRGSSVDADHWRTPEGLYYVVAMNDQSRFYKALVLNYPSADDAREGLSEGLITEHEYYAILEADQRKHTPPMDTALGGWIEIHGEGTGARTMWTRGCVAIPNESMDQLWSTVREGTPVLIEP